MYTLMHISDLHRSGDDQISNTELLSCLITDCDRFSAETSPISIPEAIVVSGDLVQGLPLDSPGYPKKLERQYDEALELLVDLANHFFGGDRTKVIIVPGNHDVDWNLARSAMEVVNPRDQNISMLLSSPNSSYRWSWESRELLRVTDRPMYENRFKCFWDLLNRFYQNAPLTFPLDAQRSWNLFKLDGGNITVCTFNSCENNDCFNLSGEIPRECIAEAHLELRKDSSSLNIAVWHHDVEGPPRRSDYMDQGTVKLMIDRGYRLGLHGHRHKSHALTYSLYTSNEHIMALVGCGSLCAASTDLPPGLNRQYNVIEIADDYQSARVHVREMIIQGVFSAGRFTALGGHSYEDVKWTPVPKDYIVNPARSGGAVIARVEQIEKLIFTGSYDDAINIIDAAQNELSHYGHMLLTEALLEGQKWDRLAEHLSDPQNPDELTKLLRALAELENWTECERVLSVKRDSRQFPDAIIRGLTDWFNAEKGLRQ